MTTYSAWSLLKGALSGQTNWSEAWRDSEPKQSYDAVIIGGGGHGLATAYYLAKNHGINRIAVLEKGWLGGGNTGRNTTIIRSNYFFPESTAFYDFSLRLYEGLSKELNYNIMFSQRGLWVLAHDRHGEEMLQRAANAMRINGAAAELHGADEVYRRIAGLNRSGRFPVRVGLLQNRGGSARHDAVAWAYARAASKLGVDIIQGCEVTNIQQKSGRVEGVQTNRGFISTPRIGVAVAGSTTQLATMAGIQMPVLSYALQAYVSEPVKPVLNTVLLSAQTGVYVSQSDKGELVIGAGLDLFPSYAQRGTLETMEQALAALLDLFPQFSRMRILRQWSGTVDVMHDSTPVVGKTSVDGLYFNCGWGTGGFKAIPGGGYCFAHTIAHDRPHPLTAAFGLDRFNTGAMIDEAAGAGIAH